MYMFLNLTEKELRSNYDLHCGIFDFEDITESFLELQRESTFTNKKPKPIISEKNKQFYDLSPICLEDIIIPENYKSYNSSFLKDNFKEMMVNVELLSQEYFGTFTIKENPRWHEISYKDDELKHGEYHFGIFKEYHNGDSRAIVVIEQFNIYKSKKDDSYICVIKTATGNSYPFPISYLPEYEGIVLNSKDGDDAFRKIRQHNTEEYSPNNKYLKIYKEITRLELINIVEYCVLQNMVSPLLEYDKNRYDSKNYSDIANTFMTYIKDNVCDKVDKLVATIKIPYSDTSNVFEKDAVHKYMSLVAKEHNTICLHSTKNIYTVPLVKMLNNDVDMVDYVEEDILKTFIIHEKTEIADILHVEKIGVQRNSNEKPTSLKAYVKYDETLLNGEYTLDITKEVLCQDDKREPQYKYVFNIGINKFNNSEVKILMQNLKSFFNVLYKKSKSNMQVDFLRIIIDKFLEDLVVTRDINTSLYNLGLISKELVGYVGEIDYSLYKNTLDGLFKDFKVYNSRKHKILQMKFKNHEEILLENSFGTIDVEQRPEIVDGTNVYTISYKNLFEKEPNTLIHTKRIK